MRYKSYVVTYAGDLQKVNRENYFLNGIYKEDDNEISYYDGNREFGIRNLYGISSGVKCDEAGEVLSLIAVELMKDFVGQDFGKENRNYFEYANSAINSQIFDKSGEHFEVDTSVLYIENDVATVYNIGNAPVFYFNEKEMKKLSGSVPEFAEVERKFRDKNGEIVSETVKKKTIPYMGYRNDGLEAVPFSSEPMKIKTRGFFVLCSQAVIDTVGQDRVFQILKDKKIKNSDKAAKIVEAAIEKKPDGTYTVEIVQVGRGIPVAASDLRSLVTLILVTGACVSLFLMGSFFIDPIVNFTEYCKMIVKSIGENEESDFELRWIPKKSRDEDAEIWDWEEEERKASEDTWGDEYPDDFSDLDNAKPPEKKEDRYDIFADDSKSLQKNSSETIKTPSGPQAPTPAEKPAQSQKTSETTETNKKPQSVPASQPKPQSAPATQPESAPVPKGENETPIDFD